MSHVEAPIVEEAESLKKMRESLTVILSLQSEDPDLWYHVGRAQGLLRLAIIEAEYEAKRRA